MTRTNLQETTVRHHGADHVQLSGAAGGSLRFQLTDATGPATLPLELIQSWETAEQLVNSDLVPRAYRAVMADQHLLLESLRASLGSDSWIRHLHPPMDDVLTELAQRAGTLFMNVVREMKETMAGASREENEAAARYAKAMVNRYWMECPLFARSFEKPRGYAGDYLLMHRIYRQNDEAPTLFGRLLNRFYLALPVVRAGCGRIPYLTNLLHAELVSRSESELRIASLACGPAEELLELFRRPLDGITSLTVSLLDQDSEALTFCHRRYEAPGAAPDFAHLEYYNVAVRLLLKERESVAREIGSYDVIYTVGLFDYLPDDIATRLIESLLSFLRPMGLLIVGNFTHHDAMTLMDHLADWPLLCRSQEALQQLADAAMKRAPGSYSSQVRTEETGLMLFLMIRKE